MRYVKDIKSDQKYLPLHYYKFTMKLYYLLKQIHIASLTLRKTILIFLLSLIGLISIFLE